MICAIRPHTRGAYRSYSSLSAEMSRSATRISKFSDCTSSLILCSSFDTFCALQWRSIVSQQADKVQADSFDGSYKENRLDRKQPWVYLQSESRWSIGRVEMTLPPGRRDAGRCGTCFLLFLPPKPLSNPPLRGFIFSTTISGAE